jgi:hypothetical protein
MASLDLRPLSLGEILDRSFSLYRENFILFVGIAAIPRLLVLALRLVQIFLGISGQIRNVPGRPGGVAVGPAVPLNMGASVGAGVLLAIVSIIAYLLIQGGTVSAVADLYMGRSTTISGSFRMATGELGTLFGVTLLTSLVILGGLFLLVIPGIYLVCRLIVSIPAAVVEKLGARKSLHRSLALTSGSAGRAFMIILLYFVLAMAVGAVFTWPPSIGLVAARNNPAMMRMWMAITQVSTEFGGVLITPILMIATSVFYFDLRVRKEAFDLQIMLNPAVGLRNAPGSAPSAP